jgi:lysyl-tRNA synthetase class 2
LAALRSWFSEAGYLEVQTPTLVSSPALEANLYSVEVPGAGHLRTSPEFGLKKALSEQLGRIYEIGPCFRANEEGPWHRREFTMVEWYRVGASLWELMDDFEALVAHVAGALNRPSPASWGRVSVSELFQQRIGLSLASASTGDLSQRDAHWDDAFFRRWVDDIEPTLTEPVLVYDWPASQAALATIRNDNIWPAAQRFEAFLGGVELANAFHELTDPVEQAYRFQRENKLRVSRGDPPHPVDEALCEAVGRMPPTSGIALGFDRLLAVLCGWDNIG